QVDQAGPGEGALPGLAGQDLLARLRRKAPGRAALQRARQKRRAVRPHRARPRPPGLRLGRLAVPGDRGDGRRLGRHRRLAAAERAGQHRLRRVLGVHPPRRRGGHRPVHPRRPGLRGRRHRTSRRQARTSPDQRPGHGRDQAHRRRLLQGLDRRRRARRPRPDGSPMSFAQLWRALEPLGRDPQTGGYRRYSWTPADAACRAWFTGQAQQRGLAVEPDNNGNLWAWWGEGRADAVMTGSHLDSVPDGGGFDGGLGVVTALAAVDLLKEQNFYPERPVVLAAFTEEEGARFGVPCLGSRLLTGAIEPQAARQLTDDAGVTLAGSVPAMTCSAPSAPSSSCTSSRAAPWPRWAPRSASPRASGRTGAGG